MAGDLFEALARCGKDGVILLAWEGDMVVRLGGNDSYFINHAGDRISEAVGGGADRVFASMSYALNAGATGAGA